MAKIALQIVDDETGEITICKLSMHSAQKLYKTLREIVGDVQYEAKPGELITVPDAKLHIG